jgi:hypothetical protein
MIYLVFTAVFVVTGLIMVNHSFTTLKGTHVAIGVASLFAAAICLIGYVISETPDLLDYDARQAPYYQDALNGTPAAMLAYCDNAPRYFGDCLARLELEATVTAQARGER